ncbi:MAG: dipeptidase [Chloroflexi bacterium]|nr:dipeptidase [Chloroflexota bacterium]
MDAKLLHEDALIWDAHRDVAYEAPLKERFLAKWMVGVDLHLDRVRSGGIDVQVYAICLACELGLEPTAQALKELDAILNILDTHQDEAALVTTTGEALAARQDGRLAVILSLEGAESILTELGLLRMFYRLGFRNMGLTWNFRNPLADGGYAGRDGGGLSSFGVEVVKEMNRLGMMVDLAHMTPAGMRQILQISELPVIHSHGGTRHVTPEHPRTLDDDMLEAIARNGGVFCVTTVPEILADASGKPSLDRFLDHIEHAVSVMGVDHVGLGADFDIYTSHLEPSSHTWVKDLEEANQWPNVTAGLLRRGIPEADIRKIMGDNLRRVFQQVIG